MGTTPYRHDLELIYQLSIGGNSRIAFAKSEAFAPAIHGLNELEARVATFREEIGKLDCINTKFSVAMDNSELHFRVETNDDISIVLSKMMQGLGQPTSLYGTNEVIMAVEPFLNNQNVTTYASKTITPTSISERFQRWLIKRQEGVRNEYDGKITVPVFQM